MFITQSPFEVFSSIGLPSLVLAKWALVLFLCGYAVFAFVLNRQTKMLANILGTSLSPAIKGLSLFHFGFSLLVLLLSLLVL